MGEDHADAIDKSDALSSHYVLVSDIDASGTENWNGGKGFDPIGDCGNGHSHQHNNCGVSAAPFTGTFDGQSHRISNLTIDRPNGVAVGLFGLAEGAAFESIRLVNVSITGEENVGGLVGHMQQDGGGYPAGSVKNVSVRGNVTWSEVNDEGASGGQFGGIVGLAANTPLNHENVFVGNVTGQYNVGGLVGRMAWSTTIGNSYARGTVTSTASSNLAECGDNGMCEAGGLAGNSGNPSDITNTYAAVIVDAPTAGAIIGDGNGGNGDTLTNVYWDKDLGPSVASSGPIDDPGSGEYTGLSTSEMQGSSAETNMNLDWTNTWQTVAGDYPVFQWEATAVENPTIHSIEASDITVDEDVQDAVVVTATDEFGNSIGGETITVETNDDDLGGVSVGDTATTDSNGDANFTFTEATPGQYAVEFSADGGSITDTATVTVNDAAPTITGKTLAPNNSHINVTFSEGIYRSDGTSALTASNLTLTFVQNGGSTTGVAIDSVTKTDGTDLTGGETTVRVNLSLTNAPAAGTETVEIQPADGSSIADGAANAMASTETTGEVTLNDRLAPTISAFESTNPSGQDVAVTIEADEPLATIEVTLTGAESATLTAGDFTESGTGPYSYAATYGGSKDGSYDITLNRAGDGAGNDGASGETDSVSVDTTPSVSSSPDSGEDDELPPTETPQPTPTTTATPVPTTTIPAPTPTSTPEGPPEIAVSSRVLSFGNVTLGTTERLSVTVENLGTSDQPLVVESTHITGANPEAFAVTSGGAPFTLHPGQTHAIEVAFTPESAGTMAAQLQITSNAGVSQIDIWLTNTRTYVIVQDVEEEGQAEAATGTVAIQGVNVDRGGRLSVNVSRPGLADHAASIDTVQMTLTQGGNFSMNVTHAPEPVGTGHAMYEQRDKVPLQYVYLEHPAPEAAFDETAFVFRVKRADVSPDVDPEQIEFHRFEDGSWEPQSVTFVRETTEEFVFRVETDGFSQFVVTAPSTEESTAPVKRSGPGPLAVGLGVLGLGAIVLLFVVTRRQEENSN